MAEIVGFRRPVGERNYDADIHKLGRRIDNLNLLIDRASAVIEDLKGRIEELEKKRGPGRPKKDEHVS